MLAHLVEKHMQRGLKLEGAVGAALRQVEGTYGIAVICASEPGVEWYRLAPRCPPYQANDVEHVEQIAVQIEVGQVVVAHEVDGWILRSTGRRR